MIRRRRVERWSWRWSRRLGPLFLLLCLALSAHGEESVPRAGSALQPFLQKYCLRCHSDERQEGHFRLDSLPSDFSDQQIAQRWGEVVFRMNAREMPPADEPQPSAAELGPAVEWIVARIQEGEAARMARRGPVAHYRLSREEYGHTVYDLLGVYFDVKLPGAFNEDPRWHGFERLGSLLSLSPSHVERYFRAAETIVERAFPDQLPASEVTRRTADDGRWQEQGEPGPVRWLLWPGQRQAAFVAKTPGLYRLRIRVSGLPSFRGRLPHLALWHHALKRPVVGRDVAADEAQPVTLEWEEFLPEGSYDLLNESPGMFSDGHTLSNSQFVFRNTRDTLPRRPTGYKLFDEAGRPIYPLLMVDSIEAEGPIVLPADAQKRAGLFPVQTDNLDEARACLQRVARRAWRRPVTATESERYLRIIQSEQMAGENSRTAYRTALVGILTSKNFYYLAEGSAGEDRRRVNDAELAARMSYFLWSSLPDEELFATVDSGSLSQPAVLRSQLTRMLGDARVYRLLQSFPRQWLQLHRVGQFPADPELFPDYDRWLEESMVEETTRYFATMYQENRPLKEFLDSDWTVLNPRLALHYGLGPLPQAEFQKVTLPPASHRGGLLTHASVLSLTSDGTRHRPVHRGVWLSEAIFARTPPAPPPNVEPLSPTPSDRPKATIRQQLEAHATHAVCASCHRNIDPLGFAFDHFDAIGRWRTEERVSGGQGANPPVDASGTLPDGRPFAGPDQFKQLLAADIDRFAAAFVEQLATYALRRAMTIDDARRLSAIAQASRADDYRLRTVIENLVLSDLFQQR